jgi:hypothetical protein
MWKAGKRVKAGCGRLEGADVEGWKMVRRAAVFFLLPAFHINFR